MISRRQFFSILMVFFTVVVLFQGLQVGKRRWNQYETNPHVVETGLRQRNVWFWDENSEAESVGGLLSGDHEGYTLFVGDRNSDRAKTAQAWADFAKRELRYASSIPSDDGELPDLILIEPRRLTDNIDGANTLLEAGVDLVCLELPGFDRIVDDNELRNLLGILSVRIPEVDLDGVHLFPGFLLGGERIYQPSRPGEEELQDLELTIPWYIVRPGTKTYMRGILGGEQAIQAKVSRLKNEDMPAILWRNHHANGEVYAVNGTYMSDPMIGMGILSAIMSERFDYTLYPVVNAQLFTFLNFPEAAAENTEKIHRVYGGDQLAVERNILLPVFSTLNSRYNFALTFCMAMQYDYEDGNEPEDGVIEYYLSHFNELGAELAISTLRRGETPLMEKLERDYGYVMAHDSAYQASAIYVDREELKEFRSYLARPMLDQLRTVLTETTSDLPILGYLDENVTLQQATFWADHHTYTEDLELLGLETTLGYSNTCFDMASVLWPESEEDEWQNKSKEVMSNLTTYYRSFEGFERLTASKSDARVRRFLNLNYRYQRTEDTITVGLEGLQEEAYFLLRLHGEKISSITGGSWTRLEDDAYLITAAEPRLEIVLAQSNETGNG